MIRAGHCDHFIELFWYFGKFRGIVADSIHQYIANGFTFFRDICKVHGFFKIDDQHQSIPDQDTDVVHFLDIAGLSRPSPTRRQTI